MPVRLSKVQAVAWEYRKAIRVILGRPGRAGRVCVILAGVEAV